MVLRTRFLSTSRMPDRPKHTWGPLLWGFIHTISIVDFEEEAQVRFTKEAVESLRGVGACIPCKKCRVHYDTFFQTEIEGRDRFGRMELFRLFVEFHNTINQKYGKPVLTYEEAHKIWAKTI